MKPPFRNVTFITQLQSQLWIMKLRMLPLLLVERVNIHWRSIKSIVSVIALAEDSHTVILAQFCRRVPPGERPTHTRTASHTHTHAAGKTWVIIMMHPLISSGAVLLQVNWSASSWLPKHHSQTWSRVTSNSVYRDNTNMEWTHLITVDVCGLRIGALHWFLPVRLVLPWNFLLPPDRQPNMPVDSLLPPGRQLERGWASCLWTSFCFQAGN